MPRLNKEETLERDKEIIRLYTEEKLSCNKISLILNMATCSVHRRLKANNVTTRSNKENSRKYHANDDFFAAIDTENKAYWLGFIYADGYLTNKKDGSEKKVGIALHSKDRNHLQKFLNDIDSDYHISDYKQNSTFGIRHYTTPYSRVLIASEKMYSDLLSNGVFLHKSNILLFPGEKVVPKSLQKHFIRGYFDGDGSIKKDDSKHYSISFCGTLEFLTKLFEIFQCEYRFEYRYKEEKRGGQTFVGKYKDVEYILDFMYKDSSIYLDRKFERYKLVKEISRIREINRRRYSTEEAIEYIRKNPYKTNKDLSIELGFCKEYISELIRRKARDVIDIRNEHKESIRQKRIQYVFEHKDMSNKELCNILHLSEWTITQIRKTYKK